jgi:hypothetical protein
VFLKGVIVSVAPEFVFTVEDWYNIQLRLDKSEAIPDFISLLHDAEEHASRLNFRGAMIDLATSCEVFLRQQILRVLPSEVSPEKVTEIEMEHVARLYNHYFPDLLDVAVANRYKPVKKELGSLFSKRNKIMHVGDTSAATATNSYRFIKMARALFGFEKNIAFHWCGWMDPEPGSDRIADGDLVIPPF